MTSIHVTGSGSPGVPPQVRDLLAGAARSLLDAAAEPRASDRFARAHLAALRTTAALLAARARPPVGGAPGCAVPGRCSPRSRPIWASGLRTSSPGRPSAPPPRPA